jgi:hypothetical protein
MTPTLVISLIALLFSAVSIGWNIYQYYDKLCRKLRITFHFAITSDCKTILSYSFKITNISQSNVVVDRYEIYFNHDENYHVAFPELARTIKTPLKIEPGFQLELAITGTEFADALKERKAQKVRIDITDTMGKHHKSDWFTPKLY